MAVTPGPIFTVAGRFEWNECLDESYLILRKECLILLIVCLSEIKLEYNKQNIQALKYLNIYVSLSVDIL